MDKRDDTLRKSREAAERRPEKDKPNLVNRYKQLGIASVKAAAPYCTSNTSQGAAR